jgi:hypothetical protein
MTARAEHGLPADLNGQDMLGARRNASGETIWVARPGDFPRMSWFRRGERHGRDRGRPGAGMIGVATALLFALGAGLLGVSLAAQYSWLLEQRHHQNAPALIEALALDVGLLIFSLLALGLARAGKQARVERILIMACAAGSATMNFAAANDASPRSILAYCMPPVFLAVVTDRVISVVRRHYLGDEEHSPWVGFGRAALYALRFTVAAPSTAAGARRALLTATPLPTIEAPSAQDQADVPPLPRDVACPYCDRRVAADSSGRPMSHLGPVGGMWCKGGPVPPPPPDDEPEPPRPPREGTKTAQFLRLVEDRQGPLAGISLDAVGAFSTRYAPEAKLHPGSARTALRAAVLAAQRCLDCGRRVEGGPCAAHATPAGFPCKGSDAR